ncbi:MAG: SLC13/DASS family transporter [Bradymonadales bacterium]|nr:MAG: SLC13/DASS family transporter [Bradymonadales bacterium]
MVRLDIRSLRLWAGLLGPVGFFLSLRISLATDLGPEAQVVLGLLWWMLLWWIFEIVPLFVTALLPALVLPILSSLEFAALLSRYSSPVIALFLGGFLLSAAIEKCGLHQLFAQAILRAFGSKKSAVLLAMMTATAFMSAWISNTASAVIALPLVLSVLRWQAKEDPAYSRALLLGVAYAASVGGVATIIGSPPNAILVGYLAENGISISFLQWMLFALPLSLGSLIVVWLYLSRVACRFDRSESLEIPKFSSWSLDQAQRRTLIVFLSAVFLWIFRAPLSQQFGIQGLTDEMVALSAACLLFLIPSGKSSERLLEAPDLQRVSWGILILFGGGLALSFAVQETGLAEWIALQLKFLNQFPSFFVIWGVCLLAIFMTEVTSNTAIAALLVPLVAGLGSYFDLDVAALLMATVLACSFAFMLPIATPPNAVVFSLGKLKIKEMAKAGLALNLFFSLVVAVFSSLWLPLILRWTTLSLDGLETVGP